MQDLVQLVPELLDVLFAAIVETAAGALGGGNLMVFQEIGLMYTDYGLQFCETTEPDPQRMENWVSSSICDNNCTLAQSMWAIWRAQFVSQSRSEKDQELLLQGMLTGLQEQTRLQPFLNASLPGYFLPCWPWPSEIKAILSQIDNVDLVGEECISPEIINTMATAFVVHLLLGDVHLQSFEDLPPGTHQGANFSVALSNLTLPATLDTMRTMLNRTDGDNFLSDPFRGTAASDWNLLDLRMKFVAPMFWIIQDHPDVNCYVYTADQEATIRANQTDSLDKDSWKQLCIENCCEANGRWTGQQQGDKTKEVAPIG